MFNSVLRALIVAMTISSPVPLAADPICLGQAVMEFKVLFACFTFRKAVQDPEWEGHGWAYTTAEGAELNACLICLDSWESVPEWVAGLERICPQTGWDIVWCDDNETLCLVRPAYDWDTCQEQILRCPTVIGC